MLACWPTTTAAQQHVLPPSIPAKHDNSPSHAGESLTIRFTSNEGTWMSLDISPDGKTIVFDFLGNLYTLPIDGGRARALTSGTPFDAQPRFSPDGHLLAFVSDRSGIPNLWVMGRNAESPRQLSNVRNMSFGSVIASPSWSPDGRTIVVSQRLGAVRPVAAETRHGYQHGQQWLLASYEVASKRMRWISDTTYGQARQALGPAFSADDKSIFAGIEPYASVGWIHNWRVERIDLATGVATPEMVSFAGRDGFRPAVSPDGRYLAYVSSTGSRYGVRLRDLGTLAEHWLVRERLELAEYPLYTRDLAPGYAFTPDSKALIAAYDGKIHRIDLVGRRESIIPFTVDVKRELGPMTVHQFALSDTAVRTRGVRQPALSPDGRMVSFSALNRLWVMELPYNGAPAGVPRRVTRDSVGEFYPSWSPDGEWIVYSTWRDGEGGAVRRVRTCPHSGGCGTSERLTSDTAIYFHTAVSPDGKRIVAVRAAAPLESLLTHSIEYTNAAHVSLVWMPFTGGLVTRLPATLSQGLAQTRRLPIEQVYFTNDPDQIYVGLISFRWGSSDQRTQVVVASDSTLWAPLRDLTGVVSPDRQRVLLDRSYELFEATLPAKASHSDTLDLERAQRQSFEAPEGAAIHWGRALAPWISWSSDGRRVLFVQGGTLFVGDVRGDGWTRFTRVDVPLAVPVDIPHGTLVLRGARLITMRGREVIAHGDLVVRDNRITAVGRQGAVALPAGAQVLDVRGKTVLPGYVDIHDHLPIAYGMMPDDCWVCHAVLAAGVTASRSAIDHEQTYSSILALAELERAGAIIGPRLFSTGVPNSGSELALQTRQDAAAVARPISDYFGGETFKEYDGHATREARKLIAQGAQEAGLNPTIHVTGLEWGLTALIDGYTGVEHPFSPSARLYDDVLRFVAKSGATQTMTYSAEVSPWQYLLNLRRAPSDLARFRRFVPPSARDVWGPVAAVRERESVDLDNLCSALSSAAGIALRGGRVGMGSHGLFPGLGFHYEMWLHALGGMPNHAILRSATIVGATAIGHARDFGSLEPGKLADLQILDRNPLRDIQHTLSIRYVMKNGRLYRAHDLTEMWPRQRALSPIYLFDAEPKEVTRHGADAAIVR
jgi:imidazolonepropionase-like amidohydrolase/Tol biopolymer transport system component